MTVTCILGPRQPANVTLASYEHGIAVDAAEPAQKKHRLAAEVIAADLRAAGLTIGPTIDLPEQYIVASQGIAG